MTERSNFLWTQEAAGTQENTGMFRMEALLHSSLIHQPAWGSHCGTATSEFLLHERATILATSGYGPKPTMYTLQEFRWLTEPNPKPNPLSKQLSPQQTCVPHHHPLLSSLRSPYCHAPAYSAWTSKRSWLHPSPCPPSVVLLLILLQFMAEPLIPKGPN